MQIIGKTDVGRERTRNEDCFDFSVLSEELGWAVVCDGMGGAAGGECASRLASGAAMNELTRHYKKNAGDTDLRKAMNMALKKANTAVWKAAHRDLVYGGMGTTMVMAVMNKRVLHISTVGDSRIYSFCSGVLNQLTRDHSLVQDMVELGYITKDQAKIHPERNVITRAIGISEQVEEDYRFVTLKPGDTILLCTDGLSGFVTDEEIALIMLKYRFENICERLIECANAHGGGDNITAVIMRSEA
ncbi:MAG TPA: Stp1/IreP family PP2C-type Ser/Thr phosphatase [Oscillospiraceae bacterium]|nr:Stp1/IreP family PP2C-type Ser/Thr phosphatase [Oscillospiraceae bacterium]HPS35102.1 Stp1/IreP family PP2C-type Ser/Thr phosphatase [Oscillospiraceae bacterium]